MKIWLILSIIALSGCTQPQAKPEPALRTAYRVEQRMSPAMKAVVMELVWLRSDPNVFKVKEIDPFSR